MPLLRTSLKLALVLVFAVCCGQVLGADDDDEDAILSDVRYLYADTTNYIDPNDMLADFDTIRKAGNKGTAAPTQAPLQPSCGGQQQTLDEYITQIGLLEKQLQAESSVTAALQRKLSDEGRVDYEPYYRRTLALLRRTLQLDEDIEGSVVIRQVHLSVASEAVATLARCLHSDQTKPKTEPPHKCDDAVSAVLGGMIVEPTQPNLLTRLLAADWHLPIYGNNSLEIGLTLVAVILLLLLSWASLLLLRDFRSRRSWLPFVVLILLLAFTFCCLWNWRNMIKEVESRRAAEWEMRGPTADGGTLPAECRDIGYWGWLWGTAEKCHRYYESSFISAAEEITPEVVIVRTAMALFLQPLRGLGRETGHFFKEFYGNIPFIYMIPASIMLIVLLLLMFGYSLELPFFMGGIRPAARPPAYLTEEAIVNRLRDEQHAFLEESRLMMLDVTSATRDTHGMKPILNSTYHTIQAQLDNLIKTRLKAIMKRACDRTPQPLTALEAAAVDAELRDAGLACTPRAAQRVAGLEAALDATPRPVLRGVIRDGTLTVPLNCSLGTRRNLRSSHDRIDGSTHGGSTHGGSTHGGSTHGDSTHGGSTNGASTNGAAEDSPAAICSGSAVEEGEEDSFYRDVRSVLDVSLNTTQKDDAMDVRSSPGRSHKTTDKSTLGSDATLSPASKKFLSKVQSTLEE